MRLLNKRQVREKTSLSQTTIDRLEKEGDFPRRGKITPNGIRVGWEESEIDEWIEARLAKRSSHKS